MATRFTLPHIDISALRTTSDYSGEGSPGSSAPRIRAAHGAKLIAELDAALAAADELRSLDDRLPPSEGAYVEVDVRGASTDILEYKTPGIFPRAVKQVDNIKTVALYVPNDEARAVLAQVLEDYRAGPLTPKGQEPQRNGKIAPIEAFRRARLETLWTDSSAVPTDPQHQMWWAIWCHPSDEDALEDVCVRLNLRSANRDRRLYFPEITVVPVLATRAAIELMMFATGIITELRRASDNPIFFIDEVRDTQHEWSDDLAERIVWPGADVPAVCVLDTGVNRGHALIEPAAAIADLHAVDEAWGVDDHDRLGHGTAMAGMCLHGDLTARLADTSEITLTHRLESVKLLPPTRRGDDDPSSYGPITQSAVSLPEIAAPERTRIFCMAVTNDNVSGAQASSWSAAIDQAAAGTMIGDDEDAPRRLFVVSGGNTPDVVQMNQLQSQDHYPIEDPAQAWNALTVGGYTDMIDVQETGYADWTPMVEAGALSPHSRTSVNWTQGRTPFKPELVLEAGNRAVNPARTELLTLESLGLLSTGHEAAQPLVPFRATSAATALAARMAAEISAQNPEYWPETVRGLMIHSAEWTAPMLAAFAGAGNRRAAYEMVRRFGYGVPDLDRAAASAQNNLALIAQNVVQPFRSKGGRRFNECHYYDLPWPSEVLEQLNNEPVELKVTLSYFVDPNPGSSANIDPQRYQSFGLRFDLKRKGETLRQFRNRVNAAERDPARPNGAAEPDDNRWVLGPNSVSAGSLHCDVWRGPAVDLLNRDKLCIKPVNGWWRNRASTDVVNRTSRYSLIVTLKSGDVNVDLYTPISVMVENGVLIETSV